MSWGPKALVFLTSLTMIFTTTRANCVEPAPTFSRGDTMSNFPVALRPAKDLGIYDSSFTMAAWVYLNKDLDTNGQYPVFGTDNAGDRKTLHLEVRRGNKYHMGFWGQQNDCTGGTTSPLHKNGVWTQVAFVYDNPNLN